jgi:hypothetical protein
MSAGFFTTQLTQVAAEDEMARLKRMQAAWLAYRGKGPKPLKVRAGQPDDNVAANKARTVVNKTVSFLFGQEITFEVERPQTAAGADPAAQPQADPAEVYLEEVWAANRKMTTLQKLAMNGAVCGHAFLKIVLSPTDLPRLIVLDPATVTVEWDDEDIERVTRYRIQYPAIDPRTRLPIIRRQVIEPRGNVWVLLDQTATPDGVTWSTAKETTWPYPFPPLIDCQNLPLPNEFWGESDLEEDVLELQTSRNRVLSNVGRILRFHAHPKTWGRGFQANQLKVAVDETIVLPGENAQLANLEMISDLGSSLEYDRRVDEALHETTRTPAIATGKVEDLGQLSGLAMQILFAPLVEKTNTKRQIYGELLAELNRRLLVLGGHDDGRPVRVQWFELLPSDPKVERDVALADKQLGASSNTLLEKLGFDPAREAKMSQGEQADLAATMDKAMNRQTLPQ